MCFRVVFLFCCIWTGSITPLEKSSSAEEDSNSRLLLPVLNSKSWFDPRSMVSLRDTSCFFGSSETSWEKEKRGGTISEHMITLLFVVEVWNTTKTKAKVDFQSEWGEKSKEKRRIQTWKAKERERDIRVGIWKYGVTFDLQVRSTRKQKASRYSVQKEERAWAFLFSRDRDIVWKLEDQRRFNVLLWKWGTRDFFCVSLLVNRNKRGRQRKWLKKRENVVCDSFEIVKEWRLKVCGWNQDLILLNWRNNVWSFGLQNRSQQHLLHI